MVSLTDPRTLGEQARRRGETKMANPFRNKPSFHGQSSQWLGGWTNADAQIKAEAKSK